MAQVAKKTIILGGSLGRMFGRVHSLAVQSVAEAVRALTILYPEMMPKIRDGQYVVFSGRQNLTEGDLHNPSGQDVIRIVPKLAGAKNAGIFSIVVGIVLIVAGFFTGGTTWGPAMMMMGGAMVITGAILMLSPQTTGASDMDSVENRASYSFNGAVNTEAQGNPVPIAYGEVICGSCVVSGGVWAEDRA